MGKSRDAFRTISEVAEWLDTQAHVLRFWESKFPQVKPVKRAGGRRYYRPQDMLLLGGIKKLLHDDGLTIKGAQKLLREKGVKYVSGLSQPLEGEEETSKTVEAAVQPAQPVPAPVNVTSEAEDYLPEDDGLPEEEEYLPEAESASSEEDDLPELAQADATALADTGDDADEDPQEEDGVTAPFATRDTPPAGGISDLFTHAQDTLESGAADGSDDDDMAPAEDTIPAFINRVTDQTVADDGPEDPADDSPSETLSALVNAADDTPPSTSDHAEDEELDEADDDAKRPASAQNEFSRDAFLIELSKANRIAAKDRPRAAELVAQLEALRTRAGESETA